MKRRAWLTLGAVVAGGAGIATYAVAGPDDAAGKGEPRRPAAVHTEKLESLGGGAKGLPKESTERFSAAMVTWTDPDAALKGTAEVRTRDRISGDWSSWQKLPAEEFSADGEEAERAKARGGTASVWAGDADGVEVRVVPKDGSAAALPTGLDVKLLDPGTTPKTAAQPAAYAQPVAETTPPVESTPAVEPTPADSTPAAPSTTPAEPTPSAGTPTASASTSASTSAEPTREPSDPPVVNPSKVVKPPIITQAQWGAKPALEPSDYADDIKAAVIHHTGVDADNAVTCDKSAARVKTIQQEHQEKGYDDIGYNFVVDKCGQIFEGRSGGVELPVIGAHDVGFNTGTFGISYIGNFEKAAPTRSALDAMSRVVAWKFGMYGIDPTGKVTLTSGSDDAGSKYQKGDQVTLPRVFGHIDTFKTQCPGLNLIPKLGQIASFAKRPGISRALTTTDIRPVTGTARDGIADLVIGAPRGSSVGRVIVVPGRTTGMTATGRVTLTQSSAGVPGSSETGDQWGASTAVGDVNGDGWGDIAIGAPGEDDTLGHADRGAVTVLYGPNLNSGPMYVLGDSHEPTGARLGAAVTMGDYNADGKDDVFSIGEGVGAHGLWYAAYTGKGEGAGDLGSAPIKYSDATSGDFNGDGYADVAATFVRTDTGKAEVYWFKGSRSGLDPVGKLNIPGGRSIVAADFNNNGYDDIVIGQPYTAESGAHSGGQVTMVYGTATGFSGVRTLHQSSTGVPGAAEAGDALGWSVSAGDYNGDGYVDLLAGAPREDITRTTARKDAGATWFFKGSSTGINGSGTVDISQDTSGMPGSTETNDHFGSSVSAGDFTGDGKADVVIGGEGEDAGAGTFIFAPGKTTLVPVTGGIYNGRTQLGTSATAHIGDNMTP
ncbi:FG-GAP-like repeat-containing protein [Streptomyces sp. NPDC050418]|uniref:FG-GAP-like repeat-containing protein n=1 Tax=Streptomyces sp. NPDC050418 TaxID=3365612 RepID=UPI0037A02021